MKRLLEAEKDRGGGGEEVVVEGEGQRKGIQSSLLFLL